MREKAKQELINQLISQLQAEENGNLPDVRAPQPNLVQHERQRQGLLGFVRDFLDPVKRVQYEHELKRIHTELETGTKLHEIKAAEAIDKGNIHREAALAAYKDKATEWRQTEELKNKGEALLKRHKDFRDLIERLVDEGFDSALEDELTQELHRIYYGPNGRRRA